MMWSFLLAEVDGWRGDSLCGLCGLVSRPGLSGIGAKKAVLLSWKHGDGSAWDAR